jgi:cell division protein FtsQ
MPAVVRGGRRQSSKPAPKKTATKGSRSVATRAKRGREPAPGKLEALGNLGLSAKATGIMAACALVIVGGVVLFTGGRAQALGSAVDGFFDDRLVDMGFGLNKVHVDGASPTALKAIKAKLKLYRGAPLARMDIDAVRAKVLSVGWVKDAKVLRLLPDTLIIAISERQALAVWQHQGRTAVIDTTGEVIPEADPSAFANLPLVVGEGANGAAADVLPLLRQRPQLNERTEALVRVDDRRWDLRLKDGSLIQLPSANEDQALIQLDRLEQRDHMLELGFARIDLRDPQMIAVRPRDAISRAAAAGITKAPVEAQPQPSESAPAAGAPAN